jgi:F-type H+-transporting ATPase subunit epsilon/F-type H+-transporting ATPase subunit delta
MSQEFNIEIISPGENVYSGKIQEVVLPCFEGQATILKDHIPFITFLRPGLISIGNGERFYVEEGTVEFSENNLLILSASVKNLKKINIDEISNMIKEAEKDILENEISDKQKYVLNYKIDTLKSIN